MEFYRYVIVEYASHDIDGEYRNPIFPNPKLELRTYFLVKETPKGFWIGYNGIKEKWVSKTSKKRFAYPTKKEALNNFIKRSQKRVDILKWQLTTSEIGLELGREKLKTVLENELS